MCASPAPGSTHRTARPWPCPDSRGSRRPGVFPLRAAGVADRPDVVLPVPPPALLQDEPRIIQRAEQGEAFHGVLHRAVRISLTNPKMTTLGWFRSRNTISRNWRRTARPFSANRPGATRPCSPRRPSIRSRRTGQLVGMGQARDEPDHVETARFHVKQVFAQQVRRARRWQNRADRRVVSVCELFRKIRFPFSRK